MVLGDLLLATSAQVLGVQCLQRQRLVKAFHSVLMQLRRRSSQQIHRQHLARPFVHKVCVFRRPVFGQMRRRGPLGPQSIRTRRGQTSKARVLGGLGRVCCPGPGKVLDTPLHACDKP